MLELALAAVLLGLPASVSSQPGPPTTLRLGLITHGVTYLPFYFAAERFFAEEGLTVEMASLLSGSRLMAAVATGSVDVVVVSLDAAVPIIGTGHAVRVFYAPRVAVGFVWFARSGIAGWADLRGRTIGVSGFGSLTDGLTRVVLRRRGLEPGVDVNVIQLGESATRLAALRAGRADAVILAPPISYAAQAHGLPILGTQETEIGELWPQAAFVTRERLLAEQPAALRALLRAYVTSPGDTSVGNTSNSVSQAVERMCIMASRPCVVV